MSLCRIYNMVGSAHNSAFQLVSNTYVNPLEYDASYGDYHRTELIQFDDGHWELVRMCEKMEDMIFNDLAFDQPGMRGRSGFHFGGRISSSTTKEKIQKIIHKKYPWQKMKEKYNKRFWRSSKQLEKKRLIRLLWSPCRQRHRAHFSVFFDFTSSSMHFPGHLDFWIEVEVL